MVYIPHCHRLSCSVVLELGSRAPIAIKQPAVVLVLVIWPHLNGNAQRRLFGIRAVFFADMSLSMHKPSASKRGCPNISVRIPCFLVGCHGRYFGLFAFLCMGRRRWAQALCLASPSRPGVVQGAGGARIKKPGAAAGPSRAPHNVVEYAHACQLYAHAGMAAGPAGPLPRVHTPPRVLRV